MQVQLILMIQALEIKIYVYFFQEMNNVYDFQIQSSLMKYKVYSFNMIALEYC